MPLSVEHPPLEKSYPANVVNVILALFPGLINTGAIALLAPVIARDFHVPAAQVARLPLLSDAALAFGCLLAAELVRRIDGRVLFFWSLGLSLVTSLVSALAPTFAVLFAAHVVHGLLGGMLFVIMLPPLLTGFGSAKIRATTTVLVPSLFGAATLGPLAGGATAEPQLWRLIFAVEVVMAVAALVLGRFTLAERKPPPTDDPIDWMALVLGALASAMIFIGVGALATHDITDPAANVPLAAGIVALVGLYVTEALNPKALVPVERLITSVALTGAICTIIGSACFSASLQGLQLSLTRLDGLTPRGAGYALWPAFFVALLAGAIFGALVKTRWIALVGPAGLVLSGIAALLIAFATPASPATAAWLSLPVALAAGLSVTPGLFFVALSFERKMVARAIAMLNLMRLTGGFISSPGVEHTIGNDSRDRLVQIEPHLAHATRLMREFVVTGAHDDLPVASFQTALITGIHDAMLLVAGGAGLAVAAIAVIFAVAHLRLRAPDFAAFDKGEAAVQAT